MQNEKYEFVIGCLWVIIVLLSIPIMFMGMLAVCMFGDQLPRAIMECVGETFFGIRYH
jgi:hypothetical protein